ncbi:MAG: hypothetical protein Cons2KO_09930 [Congregibacter sp.]
MQGKRARIVDSRRYGSRIAPKRRDYGHTLIKSRIDVRVGRGFGERQNKIHGKRMFCLIFYRSDGLPQFVVGEPSRL